MQVGMQLERVAAPGTEWDEFVRSQPGAALGHAAAWARILRESYGFEPHFLAVRDAAGGLAGTLPLVEFPRLRGRCELVSMPFLDTGGVLARDEAAEHALLDGALALARDLGAPALELRQLSPLRSGPAAPEQQRVDLLLRLEDSVEAQWQALRAKVRNQTRKAERSGLEAGAQEAPAALVRRFYEPFAINMRDLGSPVHARRFFEVAAEVWGERLSVKLAWLGDRPVGGLIAIDYCETVTVPWASSLREERARCPNNLIYWEALKWAIGRGARDFDFGRSPRSSGTHRFKVGWGAVERSLAWTRLGADGQSLAQASSEAGPLLRWLSNAWSRLPASMTTALGPRLRRYLSN